MQGRLKVLAVSTDIPRDSRLRYYDILGEFDDKSALLELIAEQMIDNIETDLQDLRKRVNDQKDISYHTTVTLDALLDEIKNEDAE